MAALARLALRGQPGALRSTGLVWLTPTTVDLLHGSLIVSSALRHTLAIRSAVGGLSMPSCSLPVAILFPIAYAASEFALPSHLMRVQAVLGFSAVFVVWTIVIACPKHAALRGAFADFWRDGLLRHRNAGVGCRIEHQLT